MRFAVLFPGQGSQYVGMGEELFEARPEILVDRAEEILGWSLRDVCLTGPDEELTRTDRAQPALYALSYVLWEEFTAAVPELPVAAAGHSLGEYTALGAAGAYDFETGLGLVAARGAAMAEAAAGSDTGMAALLGVDADAAEALAATRRADGGALWVANFNAPGQIVVAGGREDIEWITEHARDLGVRRAVPLNVAGAFHSPYMEPAVARYRPAVEAVEFGPLAFPVWANADAAPYGTGVAATLLRQLSSPVRFIETLQGIAEDVDAFVHVGPGDVTAGMAKRTTEGKTIVAVGSLADIEPAVAALSTSIQ